MRDGTHNVKQEDRAVQQLDFSSGTLLNASKDAGFSFSISRTVKTHEIITAHKLWSKLNPLRKLRSWQPADRELEPRGLKPRQSKGCLTTNGKQRPREGCDSGPKNPVYANAACSRMKEEATPWHARIHPFS